MSKLKNKRSLYWGGNENTMIPRMGACGEGIEVESGVSAGSGGGAQGPAATASAPDGPSLFDKLKGLLPGLALGALVLASVAGVAFWLKKNRESDSLDAPSGSPPEIPSPFTDADGNVWTWNPDPPPGKWELAGTDGDINWNSDESDTENYKKLGLDIEGARPVDREDNKDEDGNPLDGFDENGLPVPPDFIGQQITDEDGNLWIYKDPPGAWINFGNITPRYSSSGPDIEVPVHESYFSTIKEVVSDTIILTDESWSSMGEVVGNEGGMPVLFDSWRIIYTENPKDLYTYLQFDEDKSSLIVNYRGDIDSYAKYPHSVVYKLYEPLPVGIENGDLTYVVREMAPPYTETVQLVDYVEEDIDAVVLRNPKWDQESHADSYYIERNTKFRSYDDLVSSDVNIKEAIENEVISGSFMESIELTGVEYTNWDNFINFSSIEDRLKNFKTKLTKIELYESQSNSLSGISGSLTYEQTSSLAMKVRKIKNELTPFENYMYFQSSSYYTSSLGEFFDNSWPKSGGTGTALSPYISYPVTASQAISWYDDQIVSASLYDRNNLNRLVNNLPDHILSESPNTPFFTFLNMTGEHFDNIWTYINEYTQVYDRRQKLTEGLSRDLIYAVGTSLGFYLNDGNDLVELPRYLLGQEATGSNANTYTQYSSTPERQISREIWKRLVNNMPFFLKTRGTIRSFKGLINCYGIPSSILRVKEYGGPNPNRDTRSSYMISRKFTKAIDFKAGQYIQTTWANDTNSGRKPDTIEFRFKAASGSNQTLFQAGTTHGFAIRLKDNGSSDNYGTVSFVLNASAGSAAELSSSALPIYDGEFYSVMLNRVSASLKERQLVADTTSQVIDYRLYVKKYDEGRSKIYLSSYTTMSIHGATSSSWNSSFVGNETAYIGGKSSDDFGNQLSGSMMEFHYWNTALNSGSFDNHVRAPKSFDGNHASASWTDLVLRYSFDDDTNLDSSTSIRDTSADQSYIQAGTAVGYTSGNRPHFSSVVDEEQMLVPNIGPNRRVENKIRIEENRLVFGNLSVNKRAELSAYDLAPLDSNKLGVYFSPTDVINEDIIYSVANLDFDQYIGDPRDKYKHRYRTLENVATTYWQKYKTPNNFWDYIRLIRYYDSSLFEQLRKFIPARSRASVGLLIEPNILERKKEIVGKQPTFEDLAIRGAVNLFVQSASAETLPLSASITGHLPTPSGTYPNYEGSASFFDTTFVSGSYDTYEGIVSSSMHKPALYQLSSSINSDYGYQDYDITIGGPTHVFEEALQPTITGSRISEHNYYYKFFYTSQKAAFYDHGYTWDTERRNYSSRSLHRSDIQSVGHDNAYFRLAYLGCQQTKRTTLDLENPVTITVTSPTVLITQEPGESKLKVK